MKNVLLIGKLLKNVPAVDEAISREVRLFAASNLQEVKLVFADTASEIDIVIMGAGIDLEDRLDIVRYIFTRSDVTSVHMKDYSTGPQGFVPFINSVLKGLLK
jgi:hypothetical protein